ncbi:thermonuclease family protein [Pedobacter sp.]|jgi:endonuclease YncB( thermonuclease family)|uniref:thermonuclease family protein n=1 Tax=Pedobacter sp. TaxID=1411316 RepID=UPI002BFB7A49|nr:thermonuclease family protein [Pedobacter sp.]HWW38657.1 thermonuclease family protein [Pedobacter sp.]
MRHTFLRTLFSAIIILTFSCSQSGKPINATKVEDRLLPGTVVINLKNQTFVAKVIRIIDGDTMEVLYQNTPTKIRLAHIDCPEKRGSQPFGNNAKEALSDLCFGQDVTVYGEKYDRYRRLIAVVVNDNEQVVNQEMVRQGMAWHFKKYSTDPVYAQLEIEARENKVGLWQDPNPTPPWEWRNRKKIRLHTPNSISITSN